MPPHGAMKPRIPGSIEDAIMTAVAGVGVERVARMQGRTPSAIRKWSDPDSDGRPTLQQLIPLGVEYARRHNGYDPILAVHQSIVREMLEEEGITAGEIFSELLDVPVAVGRLVEVVRQAKDLNSPGGAAITPRERDEILRACDLLHREIEELKAAVRQDANQDANQIP